MEIDKGEMWHIYQIMKERGYGHCKFCADLFLKLKEELINLGWEDA